jgi:hypothetical protein
MLRSTRTDKGRRQSNIVWSHDQITIPRHLRDVVVTEYGVAYLRGKSDEECIQAMIEIADSEFQEELVNQAKAFGKLSESYKVPTSAQNNHPAAITQFLAAYPGVFKAFPFGSDFTPVEENLALALSDLKEKGSVSHLLETLFKGLCTNKNTFRAELERMELWEKLGAKSWLYQKILLGALQRLS